MNTEDKINKYLAEGLVPKGVRDIDNKEPFSVTVANMKKFHNAVQKLDNHIGFVKQMMNRHQIVNTKEQITPHWDKIMKSFNDMDKVIKSIK